MNVTNVHLLSPISPKVSQNQVMNIITCICKFVNANGKRCKSKFSQDITFHYNESNKNQPNRFDCQKCQFILTQDDGLDSAEYVAINLKLDKSTKGISEKNKNKGASKNSPSTASENIKLSAFIPIIQFTSISREIKVPLVIYHDSSDNMNHLASKNISHDKGVIGYVTVIISRLVTATKCNNISADNNPEMFVNPIITMRYRIRENNLLSSFWCGEAIISNPALLSSISSNITEKFLVAPAYDGLLLLSPENNNLSYGSRIEDPTVCNINTDLIPNSKQKNYHMDDNIIVTIFENQRSGLGQWSKSHLIPNIDNSSFTDENGKSLHYLKMINSVSEILPPVGYSWMDDFKIHWVENSDPEDGWIYSSDFSTILHGKKVKGNKSTAFVRSRCWKRKLCKIDSSASSTDILNKEYTHYFYTGQDNTDSVNTNWRKFYIDDYPWKVISSSKEHNSYSSPVLIPYSQISSIDMISDSILSVNFQVNRFINSVNNASSHSANVPNLEADGNYSIVNLELIITRCPSILLQSFIIERQSFYSIRNDLKGVLTNEASNLQIKQKHYIHKKPDINLLVSSQSKTSTTIFNKLDDNESEENDDDDDAELKVADEELNSNDLPNGTYLVIQLDYDICHLNLKLQQDEKSLTFDEKCILESRLIRAKVYLSLLVGLCSHMLYSSYHIPGFDFDSADQKIISGNVIDTQMKFSLEYINNVIKHDMEASSRFNQDPDDVRNVLSSIDYILDMSEVRIFDYTLHGWYAHHSNNVNSLFSQHEYKNELTLMRAIEIIFNEYFIEVINLFGKYFDNNFQTNSSLGIPNSNSFSELNNDRLKYAGATALNGSGKQTSIPNRNAIKLTKNKQLGLENRLILLKTFIKYDNRLYKCLCIVLRIFNLKIKSSTTLSQTFIPRLSCVLKFNKLIVLNDLEDEMKLAVDNCISVWKDNDKDVSGNRAKYLYSLPWIPIRFDGAHGYFMTCIIQDSIDYLNQYIKSANLNLHDIIDSKLQDNVSSADEKLMNVYNENINLFKKRVQNALIASLSFLSTTYWFEIQKSCNSWTNVRDNTKISQIRKDKQNYLQYRENSSNATQVLVSNSNSVESSTNVKSTLKFLFSPVSSDQNSAANTNKSSNILNDNSVKSNYTSNILSSQPVNILLMSRDDNNELYEYFDEKIDWICSVINDCQLIDRLDLSLMIKPLIASEADSLTSSDDSSSNSSVKKSNRLGNFNINYETSVVCTIKLLHLAVVLLLQQ